ncbi:hypothetical protein OG937_41555 [Streptomyces sp. NBC_00510]
MSANTRLTIAAHVLTWTAMDQRDDGPAAASERIAGSVNTKPIADVLRDTLAQRR